MDGQLFPQLIQFSWTLAAFIFAAQGWIFLQEFKGNRVRKCRHWFLGLAFVSNVIATVAIFLILSFVLDESLAQNKNFVADHIKLSRWVHIWSSAAAFLLTVFAVMAWLNGKNQKEETK
jgi:hypothetical protein